MARGYLGKISAIVAVNTDDARSKLSASAKDFQRYARSVQSTIGGATTSAGRSFDAIFTPLQKLQRALAATQSGSLGRTLGLGIDQAEITRVQQLVSAAEQLAKPLSGGVSQFSKLSADIVGEFQPALVAAQRQVELSRVAINQFGSISEKAFAGVEARVQSTTQAIARLVEVQNLVDGGRTGQELAFRAPRVQDELSRSAQLSQQAANLPVALREDPSVRARIEELARLRQEIARYQASVERRQVLGLDTREAQAQLDGVIRRSSDARAALERVTGADAAPIIARARAEREFYEESQRLRQQALADQRAEAEAAAAPIIARARAEREFYEESQRLRQQAEDDNRAAAQRASGLLTVDQLASNEGLRSQRATVLPPDYFQRGFESQIRGELGPAITDQQRQFDVLRGSIVSVKGQLDSLPAGLRARFIPAVQRAEEEFRRLAASPSATAAEIERAARSVDRLSQRANRAAQSLRLPSFGQFTRELGSRQAIGELQALQQILSRIGAQAGGPAAQAYELYRQRLQRAIRTGTEGLPQVRRELELLQQSAARAAAATGRISYGAALREIRRGGDIARGGFDNLSLAVQQAAFAIDDFFSSTGDFTQKIRAVQNNVTQLAFILGGTRGLFIGLGVAITAQAVVGLINWINNGRTAEDSTKALNDALARQKSLVESLAESFGNLADALTSGTLSRQAEDAQKFSDELKKAADARKELNQERIFQNDPGIRRERAEQARLQRRMDKASSIEEQISLQQQMEESRRREKNRRAVALLPAPSDVEVEGAIRRRAPNPFRRNVPDLPSGNDFDSLMARREALEGPLKRLREIVEEGGLSADIAAESYDQLNSLAARLDAAIGNALSEVESGLLESARGPAEAIRGAQEDLAAAIRDGIPGARQLGILVDEVGAEFNAAVLAVEDAAKIVDERERNDALAAAGDRLRAATARRNEVEAAGGSVRSQAILNPDSLLSAVVSRIESGLSNLGAGGNIIQARFRALQAERATVTRQLEADPTNLALISAEQDLARAISSLEGEIADLDETFNGFEAREARRLQGDSERGRSLLLSPGQKAAEELQQGLNDIFARFGEVATATTGIIDQDALRAAQQQFAQGFIADQQRAAAPAIFALSDSVENAVLQGPSRAALGVADISTQEGARELNRLLRGEDSARDQNLVELQKQSQALEEIQRTLREGVNGVKAA